MNQRWVTGNKKKKKIALVHFGNVNQKRKKRKGNNPEEFGFQGSPGVSEYWFLPVFILRKHLDINDASKEYYPN